MGSASGSGIHIGTIEDTNGMAAVHFASNLTTFGDDLLLSNASSKVYLRTASNADSFSNSFRLTSHLPSAL
jgi:hypothetical protein